MTFKRDIMRDLFNNKKNKLDYATSLEIIKDMLIVLKDTNDWSVKNLNNLIQEYTNLKEYKIGKTMWPLRMGVTGQTVTPGGGAEMLYLLGKEEAISRLERVAERLSQNI